jgi:hypothetical protein
MGLTVIVVLLPFICSGYTRSGLRPDPTIVGHLREIAIKKAPLTDKMTGVHSRKNLFSRMNQRAARGSDLIDPTSERNFLSSMQCTGRCLVDQLADGLDDPAPCCLAVAIVTRGELVSAVQHQGGGAPDVDLGDLGSPARDKLIGMMAVRRR